MMLLTWVALFLAGAGAAAEGVSFTFQTLESGSVKTATTTYNGKSSSSKASCSNTANVEATRYITNPKDLAYPEYQNASTSEAENAPKPGLLNATDLINDAIKLVGLFQTANATNCQLCKDTLSALAATQKARQETLSIVAETACKSFEALIPFNICRGLFHTGSTDIGSIFPAMDMQGEDGQAACAFFFGLCSLPPPPKLDLDVLFKGTSKPPPKVLVPSDKPPLRVLHLSDYHLDQRYVVGSEAQCGDGQVCCRVFPYTDTSKAINETANLFGNYLCDTPEPLGTSVFRSLPKVTGLDWCDFSFGIFTGDLVSHDIWELTKEYVLAEERASYQQFFDGLGGVKMYPTLGNHDTFPQAFTAFPSQTDVLASNASYPVQQQHNYEAFGNITTNYGWLTQEEAMQIVGSGLGIYRAKTKEGLVIISLNSDAWYIFNIYAYIGVNKVDSTGIFAKMIEYLLEAEKNDEPVWIIQHVPPGGTFTYEALPGPGDLFYQVVDRFNNTIRGTFFGHTHKDEFSVFYANNGTVQNYDTAIAVAWIGPSVTPYTNLNAGFRYYEVDPDTFYVRDSINYFANISEAATWTASGDAEWQFSYSARKTYDPLGFLGKTAPLSPGFWHSVTELIAGDNLAYLTYINLRSKQYRPIPVEKAAEKKTTLCGLRSMSLPIFEDCLKSTNVLGAFL